MSSVPRDLRNLIYDRDHGRCRYCNVQLARNQATIDHHVPTSKGGLNNPANLRLSCEACNNLKGSMMPGEWELCPGRRKWRGHGDALTKAEILARTAPRYKPLGELPAAEPGPDLIPLDREDKFARHNTTKPGSRRRCSGRLI